MNLLHILQVILYMFTLSCCSTDDDSAPGGSTTCPINTASEHAPLQQTASAYDHTVCHVSNTPATTTPLTNASTDGSATDVKARLTCPNTMDDGSPLLSTADVKTRLTYTNAMDDGYKSKLRNYSGKVTPV